MEFTELKELLQLFDESSVREFNLQEDQFQLYLNKNKTSSQAPAASAPVQATVTEVVTPSNPAVAVAEGEAAPVAAPEASGKTVDSPIVGIVYLSSGPDEPVFKKVGDSVAVGETLCIVEAMKIMNEITSDVAGTVTEILIKNEDVVEYGQPLFRIL